jgi:hypothetical protein
VRIRYSEPRASPATAGPVRNPVVQASEYPRSARLTKWRVSQSSVRIDADRTSKALWPGAAFEHQPCHLELAEQLLDMGAGHDQTHPERSRHGRAAARSVDQPGARPLGAPWAVASPAAYRTATAAALPAGRTARRGGRAPSPTHRERRAPPPPQPQAALRRGPGRRRAVRRVTTRNCARGTTSSSRRAGRSKSRGARSAARWLHSHLGRRRRATAGMTRTPQSAGSASRIRVGP